MGIAAIEKYILELQDLLCDGIKDLPFALRTPLDREKRSGIICIGYPKRIEPLLKNILDKYKILVTYRDSYIRISINFYNTKHQVHQVVKALHEAAQLV